MNQGALKMLLNLLSLMLGLVLALRLSLSPAPPDSLYEHLAAGRLVAAEGGFPAEEPYYYGLGQAAPYDKEAWLFGLAAHGLERLGGTKALGAARSAALVLCAVALVAAGYRRRANPFS